MSGGNGLQTSWAGHACEKLCRELGRRGMGRVGRLAKGSPGKNPAPCPPA